jgi:hypothetical protein
MVAQVRLYPRAMPSSSDLRRHDELDMVVRGQIEEIRRPAIGHRYRERGKWAYLLAQRRERRH